LIVIWILVIAQPRALCCICSVVYG
jgi:hypothetical protein